MPDPGDADAEEEKPGAVHLELPEDIAEESTEIKHHGKMQEDADAVKPNGFQHDVPKACCTVDLLKKTGQPELGLRFADEYDFMSCERLRSNGRCNFHFFIASEATRAQHITPWSTGFFTHVAAWT